MPTNSTPSPPRAPASVRYTGAVYTPQKVAAAIVDRVCDLLPQSALRILEPSVGDGAFLREMRRRWVGDHYTVVDIDPQVIAELEREDQMRGAAKASAHAADFLDFCLPELEPDGARYNLIIGNPPFIRSRNFSPAGREAVRRVAARLDLPHQNLKNSWAAFLAASSRLAADTGVLAFVLPYEILTVTYGQSALRRLAGEFKRIDIYVSSARAFQEIDQDAVVVIAQKSPNRAAGVFMTKIETLELLPEGVGLALDLAEGSDSALELNAYLLGTETLSLLKRLRGECAALGDYADSAPGIVSGANEFFIRRRADVQRLGLEEFAQPILKKGSYSGFRPVFSASDFARIEETEPSRILQIRGERDSLSPALLAYVEIGEAAGYPERFKCRKRPRWYEVPFIPREKLFFFKRAHSYPRLCLNEADVFLTDTAYGLRLKAGFSARGVCFSFYNTLTLLFAETDGRFYGGGVLELSPTEFRGLPFVYHEPSDAEFADFLEVHERAAGDPGPLLDFSDCWMGPKLGLNRDALGRLRTAWSTLRTHRLRHSGRTDTVAAGRVHPKSSEAA